MSHDAGARFEREYGCTEADWLRWLPAATAGHERTASTPGAVELRVGHGRLRLRWQALAPRTIALVRMPRLAVHFEFDDVAPAARESFLRRLDLHLQRGGG